MDNTCNSHSKSPFLGEYAPSSHHAGGCQRSGIEDRFQLKLRNSLVALNIDSNSSIRSLLSDPRVP